MNRPRYKYCPLCAGQLFENSSSLYICSNCSYRFYQNSKPAVGALILKQGENKEILLVTRDVDPFRDWWDIPGGFMENGEDPETALHREIREELNTAVRIDRLLTTGIDTYPRQDIPESASNILCLYYLCKLEGQKDTLAAGDDVSSYKWFVLDELPENIAFDANRKALEQLIAAI